MRYVGFEISNYKGIIKTNVQIREGLTPFIGVNESGKSTVLEAIASFDKANDSLYEGHFINNELIKCKFNRRKSPKIIAEIYLDKSETENFIKKLFKYLFEEYSQLARMIRTERNRDDGTIGYSIINDSELAEIQESLLELIDNLTVKQKSYKFLIQREFGPEGGKYTLLDKNDIIDDSFCINKDKRINLQGGNQIVEILSENGQKYYLDKTILSKDEFVINYILDLLPPVIYIDDFKDIIPDRITDSNNEQYIRLKNIACNLIAMEITEDEFDDIDQLESADRLTLLNQISRVINDNIGEVWNKNHVFKSPSKDDLFHIAVQLKYENGAFEFLIVDLDNADKTQNTYKFSQRSKGFKWYFNYLFKVIFNNKIANCDDFIDDKQKRIILLDEPGVYLHAAFQRELLCLLKDDSKKRNSNIIYTTHLENLLSPDIININDINIISKSAKGVLVTPLNDSSETKLFGSFDPIWNAIRLKSFPTDISDKAVVIVEGLTDMIILKLLQEKEVLNPDVIILPANGAPFNDTLVSLCLGLSKKVLLLFDNDGEGKKSSKKINNSYGPIAQTLSDILIDPKITVLETLYNQEEINLIKEPLKQNLITLYYENKQHSNRKKLLRSIAKNKSFILLAEKINEYFNL